MPGRSIDHARVAFDLVDEFDRMTTTDQVIRRMSKVLSQFGYSSFLITTSPELVQGNTQPYFILDGWPDGWTDTYTSENFYKDDPVAAMGRQTVNPYEWSDARYDPELWPRAGKVMKAAADFGLKQGFVIPILQSNGVMAGVSMAGERPDFDPKAKRAMHLIGLYAHAKTLAILGGEQFAARRILSKGEREALRWVAAGKSSWEISVILKISIATVEWRIKRASEKLEAVNRTQAVVNAIRCGEIIL